MRTAQRRYPRSLLVVAVARVMVERIRIAARILFVCVQHTALQSLDDEDDILEGA